MIKKFMDNWFAKSAFSYLHIFYNTHKLTEKESREVITVLDILRKHIR